MTLDKTLLGYEGKKYGRAVGNVIGAIGSVAGTAMAGVLEGSLAFAFNPYHIPSKIKSFKSTDKWTCLHDIVSLGTYIACFGGVAYSIIKHPLEEKTYARLSPLVLTNGFSGGARYFVNEFKKILL